MRFKMGLILILTTLTACQSDKSPRLRHAGEQVADKPGQSAEVVRPESAARPVLDPQVLSDPKRSGTVEFRRDLHQYNLQLLKEIGQNDPSVAADLKYYESQLIAGCDVELVGCTNLKAFRRSPLSSAVAQHIAKGKTEVIEHYRFLMLAFEIKNAAYDHALVMLYLRRAQEYADALDQQKKQDLLLRHGRVLTSLLLDFKDRARADEVATVLAQFKIWEFSRNKPGLLGASNTVLFGLASRGYLYVNGALNPSLVKFIEASEKNPDSFSNRLAALGQKSPYLVNGSDVVKLPPKDEYFYMVDRLFRGDLALDDAAAIWNASNKDGAKLAKFLKAVLYVELLTTVSAANRGMRDFFTRAQNLPTKKLLTDAMERSAELIPLFQSLLARAKVVRDFSSRALQNSKDMELFRDVATQYDSLDNNIKFMATYPQMLMLAYHLSKAKFEMTVRFYFFSYVLDSATILQNMMSGIYGPWFGYSNNDRAISSMDILYSLYFAFQLDSFADFKVDPSDFLVTVAKKLTDRSVEGMKMHTEHIRNTLLGTSAYREYISLCRQAEASGKINHSISLEDFLERPLLGKKLADKMYELGGGLNIIGALGQSRPGKSIAGFFLGSNYNARSFDELRTDLNPTLFRLRAITNVYRTVLLQKGLSEQQVQAKTKEISDYLSHIEQLKFDLVSTYMEAERNGQCFYRLNRLDRDRRNRLMKMEMEHLRRVHQAMTKLREQPALKESLNASLRTDTSVLKVQPVDGFDGNSLTYGRLDFVVRATQNLLKSEPHAHIRFPQDFRGSRSEGRAAALTTPLSAVIPYDADEEAFVTRAIKTHLDPNVENSNDLRHAKINWTGWFTPPQMYNLRFERLVLVALNRIGPVKSPAGRLSDSVTSADLIQLVEAQAGFIEQNEFEIEMWKKFGMYQLFETLDMYDLFINHRDGAPTPVFHHMFDMMTSDYLADRYAPPSDRITPRGPDQGTHSQISWLELGQQYFLSRQYRASFIVPIDARLDRHMDGEIRKEVNDDLQAPFAFIEQVRAREKADAAAPQKRIRIMPYVNQPAVDTEYVDSAQVQDYRARLREFHKDTGGFFQSAPATSP